MLNRAVLTGRLTRDPELRYTTSGTAVVSFTLAVDRQFRNQNGDRDADFINCVIGVNPLKTLVTLRIRVHLLELKGVFKPGIMKTNRVTVCMLPKLL